MQKVSLLDLPEWGELRRATEDLYEVFSQYPLRANIPCCAHCISDENNAKLHAKPLRELTYDELDIVMANPGTWGEEVDVKHLLPRLFELASLDFAGRPSGIDIVRLSWRIRLEGKGFATWPAAERAAVMSFCLAVLRVSLVTWPSGQGSHDDTPDSVLCAVAQLTDDLAPYLVAWRQLLGRGASLAAVAHLLVLICQREWWQEWWYVPNVYWEDRRQQLQQVRAWVEDPVTASIAQHTLRRAHVSGAEVSARWLDEDPEIVTKALAWLARQAKGIVH
jgi:hypothetical protein